MVMMVPVSLGSSPSTRGARLGCRHYDPRCRFIPVYAGSTSSSASRTRRVSAHPRLRGEHRIRQVDRRQLAGSSPSTRGAPISLSPSRVRIRLIPVYAGSTASPRGASGAHSAHPRLRGEHYFRLVASIMAVGSSPSTRGALLRDPAAISRSRLIPVYAGSTQRP